MLSCKPLFTVSWSSFQASRPRPRTSGVTVRGGRARWDREQRPLEPACLAGRPLVKLGVLRLGTKLPWKCPHPEALMSIKPVLFILLWSLLPVSALPSRTMAMWWRSGPACRKRRFRRGLTPLDEWFA